MLNVMKSRLSTDKTGYSGKKFIILFLIMTASLFSQGWNTVVQTTIPFNETTGSSIDFDVALKLVEI
jgi:hypothetical protein